jgi:hypothetical protein
MQDRNHGERLFIGCVCNYEFTDSLKAEGTARQVRTTMANVWKWDKRLDGIVDFFADSIGSFEAVVGDVFPDFFQIFDGVRVKDKLAHTAVESGTSATFLAFAPKFGEGSFTVDGLHSTALEVVVAAVQHLASLRQLLQIAGHCVLDQVVGRAPGCLGELLQAGLGFWSEANFHVRKFRDAGEACQRLGAQVFVSQKGERT